MVGVGAEGAVAVERGLAARHEGAVDWDASGKREWWLGGIGSMRTWDLVQVDANAVVLRVAVGEHAELQQRIRTVFDTGHHAARGECCLLHVAVEVLGVLV